jgi:hypothetical protein
MTNLVLEKTGTLGVELDSTTVVMTMTVVEMNFVEVELRALEVELDTLVDRGTFVEGTALVVPEIEALELKDGEE